MLCTSLNHKPLRRVGQTDRLAVKFLMPPPPKFHCWSAHWSPLGAFSSFSSSFCFILYNFITISERLGRVVGPASSRMAVNFFWDDAGNSSVLPEVANCEETYGIFPCSSSLAGVWYLQSYVILFLSCGGSENWCSWFRIHVFVCDLRLPSFGWSESYKWWKWTTFGGSSPKNKFMNLSFCFFKVRGR